MKFGLGEFDRTRTERNRRVVRRRLCSVGNDAFVDRGCFVGDAAVDGGRSTAARIRFY
jgi:hypothetical protein